MPALIQKAPPLVIRKDCGLERLKRLLACVYKKNPLKEVLIAPLFIPIPNIVTRVKVIGILKFPSMFLSTPSRRSLFVRQAGRSVDIHPSLS